MELFERFARGELDAFEVLFRQFQRQVHGWIVRLVRATREVGILSRAIATDPRRAVAPPR